MSGGWQWTYPYLPEPHGEVSALRPAVEIDLLAAGGPWPVWALIDSGSEYTLAARWVQQALGVNPDPQTERRVGIGGAFRKIRFADVTIRLQAPDHSICDEWEAAVGFIQEDWQPFWPMVLGRQGFFDRFTVTLHGHICLFVVEPYDAFDQRFGVRYAPPEEV